MEQILKKVKGGDGLRQLICFPYIGASIQIYSRLIAAISEDVEIWTFAPPGQLIAREITTCDIKSVTELYCVQLMKIRLPNCILFGHSMGAILAYYMAKQICEQEENSSSQLQLILSACNAPSDCHYHKYANLSDHDLGSYLISVGSVPDVFQENRHLLNSMMSMIRYELRLLHSASSTKKATLPVPVSYFWADKDQVVSFASALKWISYFASSQMRFQVIENKKHMYINNDVAEVADYINSLNT